MFLACLLVQTNVLIGQNDPIRKGLEVITNQSVKGQLDFLASDWMEGRNTGTKGIAMAADYITSMYQVYGIKPFKTPMVGRTGGGRGMQNQIGEQGYFQDFTMLKTQTSKEHQLSIVTTKDKNNFVQTFNYETDFTFGGRYNPTIGGLSAEAGLVFVGYGIVDTKNAYDDFKGVDVKGKIILRLRGFPGQKDTNTVAYKKFKPQGGRRGIYRYESNKNNAAIEKGAIAVIEINTSTDLGMIGSPKNVFRFFSGDLEFDEFPSELYNNSFSLMNDSLDKVLPYFIISKRLSNEITKSSGLDIAAYEKNAVEKMKPASVELANKTIRFNIKNQIPEIYRGRNVIGVIEGENPNQIVVIGAHYDHKGKYEGFVWNGADDNASGTVAVMTIARACMATGVKPKRTIVFAAWDGEEEGLLGSRYFVKNPIKSDIFANINFDMISRDEEKDSLGVMCDLTYTKAYDYLKTSTQKALTDNKIGIKMSYTAEETPSGGSDYNYFAEKKIPIMAYMAAMHKDYHRTGDKPYKVNLKKMTNIIRIGFLNTWELANVEKLK